MSKIKILILGGSIMQLPAIETAREMGWETIVADGVPTVPGRIFADYFENIDLKDTDGMIDLAVNYKKNIGLDGVFTAGTDFSETVARVAAAANLPGISIDAAIKASNKSKMRETFIDHGVPSPSFITVSSYNQLDCTNLGKKGLKFPVVVKPVDNMGSRGIRRADDCNQLKAAVTAALLFSKCGNVIIEEYLEGSEYSIDALIYDNEITICGFADRNIFYPPYFIEMGHTIPSGIGPNDYEKVVSVFKAAVKALGITEGAAKGDIRYSGGMVYVGEVAARLSGGYMSGWTYPYSSGVELTKGALKIAVGQPPGNLLPTISRTSAERAFISIPGIISDICGVKEAKNVEYMEDLLIRANVGDKVRFPENNVEKVGNCISVNNQRSIAIDSAESACRKIFVRLEACNKETEEFLYGGFQSWVPDAFILHHQENIDALERMYDFEINSLDEINIVSLPSFKMEASLEWHGKTIDLAMSEILSKKYHNFGNIDIKLIPGKVVSSCSQIARGIVLGKLFYRGFLRGGVQGGVWIIDSILKTLEENKSLRELFARWNEY